MSVNVQFRAKVQPMHYVGEDAPRYHFVKVPKITSSHVDMNAARSSRKYGGFANSDLFPGMLRRASIQMFGESGRLRLDQLPPGVAVDTSGFLALVSFNLPE